MEILIIIIECSKTLLRSSKFLWARERISSKCTENLAARPSEGSPALNWRLCVSWVIHQRPRDCKRQLSVRLTKFAVLYLRHVIAVAKCPSWPAHLSLLHWADSTDRLVSREWHGSIALVCWLPVCHSSTNEPTNTGTSASMTAETHWSTRTRLCALCPLVTG